MKFLLQQRRILEYEIMILRNVQDRSVCLHHGMQEANANIENTVPNRWRCIIHNSNNHTTEECRTYTSKDRSARLDLLK